MVHIHKNSPSCLTIILFYLMHARLDRHPMMVLPLALDYLGWKCLSRHWVGYPLGLGMVMKLNFLTDFHAISYCILLYY